jgi:hypothetical protein
MRRINLGVIACASLGSDLELAHSAKRALSLEGSTGPIH